ncbi:hypothetical protein [Methylobacterium sp. R2-1]|uniref:hypothetical protein n=1 Tax=Methylobacterium sp. R2-1 TaxID=2587064 RepID=UPI00161939C3|nr:hypothetical protein [Methylobacterium sp. R2-1]MBB2964576.1 hypothetical protein [Methylobacterium sp. R2-1]
MPEAPTVGELFKAKAATGEQVNATVDACLAQYETSAHPIADGYSLDLGDAVAAHRWATQVMGLFDATQSLKRGAVRTAILLARAQKD